MNEPHLRPQEPALSRSAVRDLLSLPLLCFFAAIFIGECVLYFSDPGHFFTADSLLWFEHRMRSIPEFLGSFVRLDPAAWYRPLTNRTIQSLLYPVLGLRPTVYHLLLIPAVLLNSVAVFALTFVVTRRRLAAAFATIFFALHTVNAYVTYDVSFFVETVYPFFYMVGVIAAIHYVQSGWRGARWISLASYALALLSKEAAVTMPATAAILCWLESPPGTFKARAKQVMSAVGPHVALMAVYLIFVAGYLHVGGVALNRILKPNLNDGRPYHLVLSKEFFVNLDFAFTWAFNLPRGWNTSARHLTPWMVSCLLFFRAFTLLFAGILLFSPRRKKMLFVGTRDASGAVTEWLAFTSNPKVVVVGIAWFVIGLTPMLPLYAHFLPYYLYMPLAGFSVLVGSALDAAFTMFQRWPRFRVTAFAAMLAALAVVCIYSSRQDIAKHALMGGFAIPAGYNLQQVKDRHPTVPPGTTFYFYDEEYSLLPAVAESQLFRLAYADDSLLAKHSVAGDRITQGDLDRGKVIVFRVNAKGQLTEMTTELMANPERFINAGEPQLR